MITFTSGGLLYPPRFNGGWVPTSTGDVNMAAVVVMDAANEKNAFFGHVSWMGKPTSKVLSSAGGKIHINMGALTFSSASSVIGIGMQSITLSGIRYIPSGTFLTSVTLTGSSPSPLLSLTTQSFTMLSGADTITHGSLRAIVCDVSALGAGDSVNTRGIGKSGVPGPRILPTCDGFTTAWGQAVSGTPTIVLEADDGTLGWLTGSCPGTNSISHVSISTGSAINEWGMKFSMPFSCLIDCFGLLIRPTASTADFNIVLYSDPDGTPATVTSVAFAGEVLGNADTFLSFPLTNPVTITSSTTYVMAVLATGTGPVVMDMYEITTAHKTTWGFGDFVSVANRGGGAGAFSTQASSILAGWNVRINGISTSSAAAGAGMLVHPGMAGGHRG